MIGQASRLVAIDSTGLETRHVSRYYTRRCRRHKGHYKSRYPKFSAVSDVDSHLFLGVVVDRGPKPDDLEFHRLALQAHRRHPFETLLGDAGYDAEYHHRFLAEQLGVRAIIPPIRGRPATTGQYAAPGPYRSELRRRWPIAEYGQRWQIETDFSMFKRLLGSALRSRRRYAIDREIHLRAITLNLMIISCLLLCFQQSRTVIISGGPSRAARAEIAGEEAGRIWPSRFLPGPSRILIVRAAGPPMLLKRRGSA